MSRIRSLLPGVFTDEAWASVSITARWLAAGLLTEADDNGVFEWKPLQLKMRIFPADSVDVPALLAELEGAGIVRRFEHDGKPFGAIKNFCRYQRPRKPKAWFTLPSELEAFVSLQSRSVPQKAGPDGDEEPPVPPKSELPQQREDVGGSREEGRTNEETKVVSFNGPFVRSLEDYSEDEIATLALTFDRLDVRSILPELIDWAGKKPDIGDLVALKSAVFGALKSRQEKAEATSRLMQHRNNGPPPEPGPRDALAEFRQRQAARKKIG